MPDSGSKDCPRKQPAGTPFHRPPVPDCTVCRGSNKCRRWHRVRCGRSGFRASGPYISTRRNAPHRPGAHHRPHTLPLQHPQQREYAPYRPHGRGSAPAPAFPRGHRHSHPVMRPEAALRLRQGPAPDKSRHCKPPTAYPLPAYRANGSTPRRPSSSLRLPAASK